MRMIHFLKKKMIFGLAFVFMFSVFMAGCKQVRANEVEKTGANPEDTVQSQSEVTDDDGWLDEDADLWLPEDADAEFDDTDDVEQASASEEQGEDTVYGPENPYEGENPYRGFQDDDSSLQTEASSQQKASITVQPKDADIRADQTAVFTVEAKGDGLHYQWQVRETPNKDWRNSRSTGCKSASLSVDGRIEYNGFQFRCQVTDKYGNAVNSNPAALSVFAITKDPTEENVKKGRTATFVADAVGKDVRFKWQQHRSSESGWEDYNGSGSTDSTLKIRDASTDFNGYFFRCKVTDAPGHTSYTKAARMYVLGVTKQPSGQNIRKGGSASFKVSATGKNIKYQWKIKRANEDEWKDAGGSGSKTPEVKFSGVGLGANNAKLRCKITDANGKHIYSDTVKLYVFGISSSPQTKYVKKDTHVTFEVKAAGKDLEYQWWQKKASDPDWYEASGSGARTSKLDLGAVSPKLNGMRYRCQVYDSEGRDDHSKTAVLYVLAITKHPSDQNVKSGTQAVFSTSASGSGLKFSWQVKESSSSEWRQSTSSGHNTKTLKVNAGISRNGYRFRCKVSDAKGNVVYSNPAVLYVPGILKNPSTQRVKAGRTATFRVTATGHGLKYSWEVNEGGGSGWRNSGSSGHNTNTLKVSTRVGYNGFHFRCKVRDSKGRTFYSKAAALYVLGIRSQPSDRVADAGKTVSFHVNAVGASVKYQWQIKRKGERWKNSSSSGNKTSTVQIKATAGLNDALIHCRLTDSAGNVLYTRDAKLRVNYINFNYVPHR